MAGLFTYRHTKTPRMSPADAWSACEHDDAIVLDVRTPRERSAVGSIPGATAASWRRPAAPPHDGPVLVVCSHGARSLFAARRLRAAGVDAHSIRGGMAAHGRAGLPVEGGDGAP